MVERVLGGTDWWWCLLSVGEVVLEVVVLEGVVCGLGCLCIGVLVYVCLDVRACGLGKVCSTGLCSQDLSIAMRTWAGGLIGFSRWVVHRGAVLWKQLPDVVMVVLGYVLGFGS